ncbi:hypothetical protein [Mycolicibacter virginiensis]|uniref:hypothetical protein n=1 Tax=Mycolicibacter virginiensis TaxID=1795032 RepID=UPI00061B4A3F|nr:MULTISPECIES: hypothetical protein [Mycobacteriaceae]ULP48924.1 hypothetical protein MJO54_07580 [Mycolicibacter virginiensis]
MGDRPRCAREGCQKRVNPNRRNSTRYCQFICRLVDDQIAEAQRVCEYLGGNGDLYAAAVAVADALTELDNLDYAALCAARDAGLSAHQYRQVKSGQLT